MAAITLREPRIWVALDQHRPEAGDNVFHCDRKGLCERCYAEELQRLRPTVDGIADKLVGTLQASLVPDGSWFHCVTDASELITRRIAPLAEDPRLRSDLARLCATRARARLEALLAR